MFENTLGYAEPGPSTGSSCREDFIAVLESEFERLFGHTGLLMVKKVVKDYEGKGVLGPVDMPIIIQMLVENVEGMITPRQAQELRNRLRMRCGLSD